MLTGKNLLFTGVVDTRSIAFAAAARAQLSGANVVISAHTRDLPLATEAAAQLPEPADVLGFDVTNADDLGVVRDDLHDRFEHLDGILHAIAFAPKRALDGALTDAEPAEVELAFRTSSWSYAALGGLLGELAPDSGGALVGLDFDTAGAWPTYNWMGVCKAALESINQYLARDLGVRGIRANLVAAGPLHTRAAGGIPGFDLLLDAWEDRAPLGWDAHDASPVADTVCFLLSDFARAITGEVLHVDGGFHAMNAGVPSRELSTAATPRGAPATSSA
jgi:enoyl-[acyl-carrier protein] reductase I